MPVNFQTYSRQFNIPAGLAEIIIKYATDEFQTDTLTFDLINIADLESGYEDDDQLTFYPNVLTITVDDFTRNNYDVLRYATQLRTPIYPFNNNFMSTTRELEKYYGVELKLNGKIIFKGYIDRNKIEYDDQTGEMTFDAVDYSRILKDMNFHTDEVGADPLWWMHPIGAAWDFGYRYIYPDLPNPKDMFGSVPITNNPDTFINMDIGYYFKHNWVFNCNGNIGVPNYTRSWDIDTDANGWRHVRFYTGHILTHSNTYADILRNLALETGCIIGTDYYNKVYMFKRFLKPNEMQDAEDISSRILHGGFNRYTHLSYKRGVRNINQLNGNNVTIEGDFPIVNPPDSNSARLFEDYQHDISTIQQLTINNDGQNGPSTFRAWDTNGGNQQSVLNGIMDPSLDSTYRNIERIITRWTYLTRVRNRDRFELKLDGINYWMHKIYLFWFSSMHYAYLRPMTIKRKLIEDTTEMTALEMNL